MKALHFAWRSLKRDARAGELKVLVAALVIAVASMTSVGFFTDRVRLAMAERAAELLAADRVITATRALPVEWERQAQQQGLVTARYANFPSVILRGDTPQLVDVKAVSASYPLRGALRISDVPYGPEREVTRIPAPGKVWLDARLMVNLGLRTGDVLSLGTRRFTVSQVVTYEPDRGGDLIAFAPRLLMNEADLASTQLIGPGSRVSHRLLVAGKLEALDAFRDWLTPKLGEGERLIDVRDARPELKLALERAEKFLGLAAMVSVLLAGVAIAAAGARYSQRHFNAVAVMRAFGASQALVLRMHFLKLLLLGLAATLTGCGLGALAQEILARLYAGLITTPLPPPSWTPFFAGLGAGVVLLVGFVTPSLIRLQRVPPARVLRQDLGPMPVSAWTIYGLAVAAMAGLLLWQSADVKLTLLVLGGALATVVLLAVVALGLVQALQRFRTRAGVAWRYGMANLARHRRASIAQIVAFGLGIMALLLLTLVRGDLVRSWQASLPADAPNQFLVNVQPHQVTPIREFFAHHDLTGATLHPMVRARLVAINDRAVRSEDYVEDRTRRLVEREFNLSWGTTLQDDNKIVAGNFWGSQAHGQREASVEQGLAERLKLQLGDRLRWNIAGDEVEVTITSLRSVEWDTFRANFFVLTPPGVIDGQPSTWMTSFHLPAAQRPVLGELVRTFPNITIIDVDAIMQRVRETMERVNQSVLAVFAFTLAAGLMVMLSAIQLSQDERTHEAALLRTLGARRAQVLKGLAGEFMLLGLLAGLLAALAASAIGAALALKVFDLAWQFDAWLWVTGIAGGVIGVGLAGVLGTRFVLNRPPMETLQVN